MPYAYRRQNLLDALNSKNIDGYLVCAPKEIRYLTGAQGCDACLLLLSKKAIYITDSRYIKELELSLEPSVEIRQWRKNMFHEAVVLAQRYSVFRLGFDPRHISLAQHALLKGVRDVGLHSVKVSGCVDRLRMKKSPQEVAVIRECLKLHKQTLRYLSRVISCGMSEREIALKTEMFVKRRKANFSFPPIVASGPNAAFPHACVTDRKITHKDAVLVDLGIELNGYTSDLTRIFISDRISRSFKDVYKAVFDAQRQAIACIRPGVAVSEADQQARKVLKDKGLDKFYIHSLGHGVGLSVHEPPQLSINSTNIFEEGMVVTVEPGVYRQGRYGVRIEDMVLVTQKGSEILSEGIQAQKPFLIN